MAKDHKQVMNSLTGATNAAKKKLADKFHAIEDLNAKYQQVSRFCVRGTVSVQLAQVCSSASCDASLQLVGKFHWGLSSTALCVLCWCWSCLHRTSRRCGTITLLFTTSLMTPSGR